MNNQSSRDVEKLLRQQAALAQFGSFAFNEPDLLKILTEAARICADSLGVPFCKVCRYRPEENDLLIEAGCGWHVGVIGHVISEANESSPQGRAYVTGQPVIIGDLLAANTLSLPAFYAEHGIISTVDVVIKGFEGTPYGVLEIDSPSQHTYDQHDINFLTGFANVLAEAVATATRVRALKRLIEEKNILAEELQHRVRNNLQLVHAMLVNQARSATDEASRQGLERIGRRVHTLGKVYDHLLGTGMQRTIDFGDYLRALCVSLPDVQSASERNIGLICRTESVMANLDTVTALGMAVTEIVTNSYGHAFPDQDGSITVSLAGPSPGGASTLTIEDDGIGFEPAGESKRHGVGLVRRLMEQVSGTAEMRSDKGTTWTLTFH